MSEKLTESEEALLRKSSGAKVKSVRAKEENDAIEVSSLREDPYLVEEIMDENKEFQFAIFNGETKELTYSNSFESNGKIYIPSQSEVFLKETIKLPQKAEVVSEEEINKLIPAYIGQYYWLDEKTLFLGSKYIKYTWIYDFYHTCPFYGPWGAMGTGKTRHLDVLGLICRKPMATSGAISEAFLYRIMDAHSPTLVINEFDRMNSNDQALFTAILNNAYEKGHPVPKMDGEGKNMKPKLWEVYGPKIFSTIDKFQSDALESRIIRVKPREFPKEIRNDYPVELEDSFPVNMKLVQSCLLGYRFQKYASLLTSLIEQKSRLEKKADSPDSPILRLMRVCEPGFAYQGQKDMFLKEEDLDSRSRQTFYPLLRITTMEEMPDLIKYVKEYQDELVRQRGEDEIGITAKNIIYLYDIKAENIPVREVRLGVSIELFGQGDKNQKLISPQKMGGILRKLRIKTEEKGNGNDKYLILEDKTIEFLRKRYSKYISLSPLSSISSSQARNEAKVASQLNFQPGADSQTKLVPDSQNQGNGVTIEEEDVNNKDL